MTFGAIQSNTKSDNHGKIVAMTDAKQYKAIPNAITKARL